MTIIVVSIIVFLIAVSALISAMETAITATSPGKMQQLKSEGNIKASIMLGILKIKDKVISTLLIGNSIANIFCTTIATSMFIDILGDEMGTIVSSIVMSFAIIVFAEVVPKAIAIAKPEKIALRILPTLRIMLVVLKPINILLGYIIRWFCLIFRIDLKSEISAEDEVRGIIEHHLHEGNVFRDDRDMMGGILDIRNMDVSEVMVHRSYIQSIDVALPIKEIVQTALSFPHSRIPIWKESEDNIIGILHIRQLLNLVVTKENVTHDDVMKLLSPPWYVPDNALVTNQLQAFRDKKTHFACVVNEYGDLRGIVTLEDILEEIVGQIYDEHDTGRKQIIKKSDTEYIIDGTMPIRELNRELDWKIPENNAITLAGFVINQIERIPNPGEIVTFQNIKFIVMKKSANRVKTIRVVLMNNNEDSSSD